MKRIIIDTNALMAIREFKVDIFTEIKNCCDFNYKLYILEGTIKELQRIEKEQRGKERLNAKLVLSLLNHQQVQVLPEQGYVDDLLVQHAQQGDLILTLDAGLKRRLDSPYLTIRQKRRVVMVG